MTGPADADLQAQVLAPLRSGAALPGRPDDVEVHETHISYVFLTADRAYKLKKAVVLPFVDYGTRERRRAMCEAELRLNRRLAPGVYLAVRSVAPDGPGFALGDADEPAAVEHVVEMTRFDADRTLAARIARGDVSVADVARVAERLARFHRELPAAAATGSPLTPLRIAADETFRTLHELVGVDDRPLVTAGDRFTRAFLAGRADEIAGRAGAGLVRECHGDLRAEHVLLNGEVEVVDCLEFDPVLRTIDVGADLAFLVMDLERLGRGDLAGALVRSYAEHGGDAGSAGLVAFHAAQRAWVRAKVALLQGRERDARDLLHLARTLAWRARGPLLLLVCGLSGSGKTTLAHELESRSGAPVFSSDPVRKSLAGLDPSERARPEHYEEAFNRRTYEELARLARRELDAGRSAIVDATFRHSADRRSFLAALGPDAPAPVFVECVAPRATLLERSAARARQSGVSDATPDVVRAQRFDFLAEAQPARHAIVRTDQPTSTIAAAVEERLDAL